MKINIDHASQYITHHENRAPTDDSVRLLREMEEEARRSIVWAFAPKDNELNILSVGMQDGVINDDHGGICFGRRIYVVFTINGHRYTVSPIIDEMHLKLSDMRPDQVYRLMAKALTDALVPQFMDALTKEGK